MIKIKLMSFWIDKGLLDSVGKAFVSVKSFWFILMIVISSLIYFKMHKIGPGRSCGIPKGRRRQASWTVQWRRVVVNQVGSWL